MRVTSLIGLLLACAKAIVADAGVVEVDLVFPRNDTYAPTPVFPIIFAFQNATLARALNPSITVDVWQWANKNSSSVRYSYELQYVNFSSSEPYLAYKFFRNFDEEGSWRVKWNVALYGCTEESLSDYVSDDSFIGYGSGNTLFFTTKNNSQEVDLVSATENQSCSFDAGGTGPVVNITDTLELPAKFGSASGDRCAVVANATVSPSPCRVHIDSAAEASISASMTSQVCSSAWFTTVPLDCSTVNGTESAAAQSLVVGGVTGLAATLGALYYMTL